MRARRWLEWHPAVAPGSPGRPAEITRGGRGAMNAVATPAAFRLSRMGKKPDKRKPRVSVNVPEEWHAVMRKLAARAKQPVLYTLIALVEAEATRQGLIGLPKPPWVDDINNE